MSLQFEQLVSAMVDHGDTKSMVLHPEIRSFATMSTLDAVLFEIVDGHMQNYGKLPSKGVIEEQFGKALPKAEEPVKYYIDQIRPLYIKRVLQSAVTEAQPHMKDDPEKSLALIEKAVLDLRSAKEGVALMDFREAGPRIIKHLAVKLSGEGFYGFGWPSFDKQSAGITQGDFISLMGFSGTGKTEVMLDRAMYQWKHNNQSVLFVSNEITLNGILERAAALHSKVPQNYFKNAMFPNIGKVNYKQKMLDSLAAAAKAPKPFNFVDGNLALGREDLLRLCSQLKPDSCWVDGAYLLGGTSYKDRWQLVAENASFMKQVIATRMGIPVVASYQFTRKAAGDAKHAKAKNSTMRQGLEDIAGSQEIGNLSTIALALLQDDTPETIVRRRIDVMKGRNGETGHLYINWDWVGMNFDEVDDTTHDPVDIT